MKFVTTPEALERFVTIEREILQIENSIQSNELTEAEGAFWRCLLILYLFLIFFNSFTCGLHFLNRFRS